MNKSDKILKFMLEHESDEIHKLFDFYKFYVLKTIDGKDLQNLKIYIKENDDNKICILLDDLLKNKKYIFHEKRQLEPLYDDLKLTDTGRKHLENLCKNKLENLKWIVTTFVAVIGLFVSILGYFYPNETKIQTIVKTELKNTTNVSITK